jgi:CIC family chloride channel protein
LAQKGINVRAGRNVNVLKELTVANAMVSDVLTLKETMTFKELLDLLPETRHVSSFPVVNKLGELSGILSVSDFQSAFFEEGLGDLVIVKELATQEVITVFPNDSLQDALTRLSSKDVAHVPVVDPQNPKKIVGILSRRDIINAYNKALLKYNY